VEGQLIKENKMEKIHFKNEQRLQKKFLNMKVKGKHPRRRPRSRWENRLGNMSHRKKQGTWEENEEEEELWKDIYRWRGSVVR
jgi:hypothetical protein